MRANPGSVCSADSRQTVQHFCRRLSGVAGHQVSADRRQHHRARLDHPPDAQEGPGRHANMQGRRLAEPARSRRDVLHPGRWHQRRRVSAGSTRQSGAETSRPARPARPCENPVAAVQSAVAARTDFKSRQKMLNTNCAKIRTNCAEKAAAPGHQKTPHTFILGSLSASL